MPKAKRDPTRLAKDNSSEVPSFAALEAYLEWLDLEAEILALELYPEMGSSARRYRPRNTGASQFHLPNEGDWRDRPKPSTRALRVISLFGIPVDPRGLN